MKGLLSTAGALALMTTGAIAQDVTDADVSVTLTAEVFEYIAITSSSKDPDDYALAVSEDAVTGTSTDNKDDHENNATFRITSNVNHDINLAWDTWSHDETTTANYRHTDPNDSCSIGGTVYLDTDVEDDGGIESPNGKGSLFRAADPSNGIGIPTWATEYGVATEVAPNITDCPGDIAKPGQYQLGVKITVSKAS